MPVNVVSEWLNACSGCEISILNTGEALLDLLPQLNFVHIPALVDHKYFGQTGDGTTMEIPEAVVGIVSGGVRNTEHEHVLKEVRNKVKFLIALGSCAGFGGILTAARMSEVGITDVRIIDTTSDFGGTWYWNRYPGIQCDNHAYCYLPLLEETGFMPSRKYADGYEIYDYFRLIADKYSLGENALFHTLISSLRWDERIRRWRIGSKRGDDIRARFVIVANGLLNIPKLPNIPGIHDYKGRMFHTSRWEYDYTGGTYRNPVLDKLADKGIADRTIVVFLSDNGGYIGICRLLPVKIYATIGPFL